MKKYIPHHILPNSYISSISAIKFDKLSKYVGAEVKNIDLSIPLTKDQFSDVFSALAVHSLLVFRSQDLSMENFVNFSKLFGELMPHIVNKFNRIDNPEIITLSNIINDEGEKIGADRSGMQWHSDGSFRITPNKFSLLYGVECPPVGANTEFSSTYAAFNGLDDKSKIELSKMIGIHDYSWYWDKYQKAREPLTEKERMQTPCAYHPAIRTHPVTGWNTTYLSEGVVSGIKGMNNVDGRKKVMEISDFSTQIKFRYVHKWKNGDLLFWDNRSLMHRATEFDNIYRRLMQRTSVKGEKPFFSGL